jgi:hypothetical protein
MIAKNIEASCITTEKATDFNSSKTLLVCMLDFFRAVEKIWSKEFNLRSKVRLLFISKPKLFRKVNRSRWDSWLENFRNKCSSP